MKILLLIILLFLFGCSSRTAVKEPLEEIKLPTGFKIEVFADGLPNARTMALGEEGTVFVGTRTAGNVYAIRDSDGDGQADERHQIASGLNMPNGIAFYQGALFVAEVERILRFDAIESQLESPPESIVIRDDLPTKTHHGWRYIAFGPDNRLYLSIGAPCNVCLEEDYAQIRSMNPDGSDEKVIAQGIRNSVGFNWHPITGELWFTDNGRDLLGDNSPPDELNRVDNPGQQHFGFPYCHGGTIADPEFGPSKSCQEFAPPAQPLGPHVAPLGMLFYSGQQFPEKYHNQVFIAEHGSWNRSNKIGYRITLVSLEDSQAVSYEPFAEGWLQGETASGRPAYLLELPDGSLLLSDDQAGIVYRITYSKP
jgi:glucose/arabinose dehydrogenase